MRISGLEKLSLVDYEGFLSCIVFVRGCNFKCSFCHNSSLVIGQNDDFVEEKVFFEYLNKRKGIITAVVVSGGEPTLYPDLKQFIKKIKEFDVKVKLDTNGTNPKVLKELIAEKLIDYVAMDIKNTREKYAQTSGVQCLDFNNIELSAKILMSDEIDYEFRTTLVEGEHTLKDMKEIGQWLSGAKKIFLQHFKDSGDCIAQGLKDIKVETAQEFKKILENYVKCVKLRGY